MRLDPKAIRSRMAEIIPIIEAECDNNPAFADKILAILDAKKEKVTAIFDPFSEYAQKGDDGFRSLLEELTNEQLIAIIRAHRLDPSRLAAKWKNRDRLVQFIIDRVKGLASKGSSFRVYGQDDSSTKS